MFLLKLGSELQNLVKKFQSTMKYKKIQTEFSPSAKVPLGGMHRGSNKMDQRGNYQDFLKWAGVFRSFSYNN